MASKRSTARIVEWPVQRFRFDLPLGAYLSPERVLLHWACIDADRLEHEFTVAEALVWAEQIVSDERPDDFLPIGHPTC